TRPGRSAHVRPVRKERPLHLKGNLLGNEKIERLSRERILHQLVANLVEAGAGLSRTGRSQEKAQAHPATPPAPRRTATGSPHAASSWRSEEHTSELQSRENLVCRLLLEKKKNRTLLT